MNSWRKRQLEEWAGMTGLLSHPVVARFLNSPALHDKPDLEDGIARVLQTEMARRAPKPHPFLPAPETDPGIAAWVTPGRVIAGNGPGDEFQDPLPSFLQQKGVFGPAGSGKTVLTQHMTIQAHRQGHPVWWFDSEDELAPLLTREQDILLLDLEDLRFNPFSAPPGCDPLQYVDKVISQFRETLYFRDGSVNLTRSVCRALFEQIGPFSLGDVYRSLLRMRFKVGQRMAQYWETCCSRFADLLSALGRTIDVGEGMTWAGCWSGRWSGGCGSCPT